VNEAAYGGDSLFGIGWHPPVRMPAMRRMSAIHSGGNAIWNRSKKIKHQMSVVHCGNGADATPYLVDYSTF
jgi:hypothetical protein